jgi:tetratricopeptide (TPR) repeat protein
MSEKKILEFERPAIFYFESAERFLDNADYIGALPLLRRAVQKDPSNQEYKLALAEALTDINRFEESNAILFELLKSSSFLDPECYFGIGCNFIGLNDFDKAKQSFQQYIKIEPDGEFKEEVEEFLNFMKDIDEIEENSFEDLSRKKSYDLAGEGKRKLDMGEYSEAIKILASVNADSVSMIFVKNNLALSYYCDKQIDKAIEITSEVLKIDPGNVHANCNMVLFYNEKGDDLNREKYTEIILALKTENAEDLYKIAVAFCELKEHEKVILYLKRLLQYRPYDEKAMFYAGLACYNLGRLKEAIGYFADIIKINPQNTVAPYYCGYVKDVLEGKAFSDTLAYIYQVPFQEAKKRIRYINRCLMRDKKEIASLWKGNDRFESMLTWGLEFGDLFIKRAVAEIISGFGDKKAEDKLKSYILNADQPDDVKNEIFVLLKRMGVAEPFIAYIGGNIVEVKVGMAENREEKKILPHGSSADTKKFD